MTTHRAAGTWAEQLRQAKIDLTAALRWADRLGLSEGICNHFSLAVPGTTDRFLLNPPGSALVRAAGQRPARC